MSTPGSVTHWLGDLKAGDADAARRLWERYFPQLRGLARKMLRGASRRMADEEDVALSAFDSFCRRAGNGDFSRLGDRDDLWRLLTVITTRKAFGVARHERRQKRGGMGAAVPCEPIDLDKVLDPEPTPEAVVQLADEFRRLLDVLGQNDLRAVALAKLEGCTNAEIAARLGCARRTVERKLAVIRCIWSEQAKS